ncbi:MAG: hypothetical protein NWR65_03120 [Saprospiraceae bacterium]|jgi:hypothetical protein|nr:hypothetical protein [Saprospiraceae bacterium]
MKFLLHKDIKEIANAQMAHLVLPGTQANASQNQTRWSDKLIQNRRNQEAIFVEIRPLSITF